MSRGFYPDNTMSAEEEKSSHSYNELAIRANVNMISRCRTALALLAGATAGILGLTGLPGFIFYLLASITMSTILAATAGAHWEKYVLSKSMLWTDGIASGLFTYVLFWTFLYGMIHVY
ncbi:ER membrane protein complex subunit 6-like [Corticium candelabrum]|uniref:ER membrane protein complex subunit 6-like n=1 Tax=Corticium candelabrum TaxID=121492 RepID=UPI002E26399C|nr:ER membrane protein complex subunit 6-like [Corticium candelabrum]